MTAMFVLFGFLILWPSSFGDFSCQVFSVKSDSLRIINCIPNNSSELVEHIDKTLNQTPSINDIRITRATLYKIPAAICQKANLTFLRLTYNNLSDLSKDCFDGMTGLQILVINDNLFTHLEDGTFDNLANLVILVMNRNKLETIGDLVFNEPLRQPWLKRIDLHSNQLKSVDSWPWIRGSYMNKMEISVADNQIHETTNRLNWTYKCGHKQDRIFSFVYKLDNNPIDHIYEIFSKIFPGKNEFICFFNKKNLNVSLTDVRVICNCIEYKIVKMFESLENSQLLSTVVCREPPRLVHTRVLRVPEDQFQCDVTEQFCVPHCRCVQVPGNTSFVIDCSEVSFTSLPSSLPPLDVPQHFSVSTKYELRFQSMGLRSIEYRDYLLKTKILNLKNNKISHLSEANLVYLAGIRELSLESNALSTIPSFYLNKDAELEKINLIDNPWDCSCDKRWFKGWLRNISEHVTLVSPNSILCATPSWLAGRNILNVDEQEFCLDPFVAQRNLILLRVLLPVACVVLLVVVSFLLLRRFKVQLNTYLALHPFDRDECTGEYMEYDIFISSSFADRDLAIWLVGLLEGRGYRVCYHEKDFIGGQSIALNICHAVWCSKRVLCVVTKSFLGSHYCMYEFEQALQRNIQLKKQRLVLLYDESLTKDPCPMPSDFQAFISSHTYINLDYQDSCVEQLFYSMPISKIVS